MIFRFPASRCADAGYALKTLYNPSLRLGWEPHRAIFSSQTSKIIYFRFSEFFLTPDPNHLHVSCHPGPHKGAFRDRHERRVGMRWTRVARLTRA